MRVERLKEISEQDAIAEGVKFGTGQPRECRACGRGALWISGNPSTALTLGLRILGCGWSSLRESSNERKHLDSRKSFRALSCLQATRLLHQNDRWTGSQVHAGGVRNSRQRTIGRLDSQAFRSSSSCSDAEKVERKPDWTEECKAMFMHERARQAMRGS